MQSYEQMAEAHVQHLQKLVPAFDNLYSAMPEAAEKADGPGYSVSMRSSARRNRAMVRTREHSKMKPAPTPWDTTPPGREV
jgi:hypothetical protein